MCSQRVKLASLRAGKSSVGAETIPGIHSGASPPQRLAVIPGNSLAIVRPPCPAEQKTDVSKFGQVKSCSLAERTPSYRV